MKKSFYIFLFLLTGAYCIYTTFNLILHYRNEAHSPQFNLAWIKLVIILFILIFQVTNSSKKHKVLSFIAFPLILTGWLFSIMHWPFGRSILLVSLFAIVLNLCLERIRKKQALDLFVLIFPIINVFFLFLSFTHLGSVLTFEWMVEYLYVTILFIVSGTLLFVKKLE